MKRKRLYRSKNSAKDFQVSLSFVPFLTFSLIYKTDEFNKYLSYVRNLGFEDEPDYNYLRGLFTTALKNTGEMEDGIYDWMMINDGKGWETSK